MKSRNPKSQSAIQSGGPNSKQIKNFKLQNFKRCFEFGYCFGFRILDLEFFVAETRGKFGVQL